MDLYLSKSISSKVNTTAQLGSELAHNYVAVQYAIQYALGTSSKQISDNKLGSLFVRFSSLVLFDPLIGPRSDGNKEVLRFPQNSSITGAWPSDCLMSYPGHSLGDSYPSAEMQSVYSTAPDD